ncbi:hypothetical protein [Micromonospora sp. HK10]|uniref:hypothetical protein n=1 Tax=Micromonospora sp. HK10 TaxID=1538294 RepID=UPI001E3E3E5D|nr:hypothetical protein [Micromonospora sp. HK10]
MRVIITASSLLGYASDLKRRPEARRWHCARPANKSALDCRPPENTIASRPAAVTVGGGPWSPPR